MSATNYYKMGNFTAFTVFNGPWILVRFDCWKPIETLINNFCCPNYFYFVLSVDFTEVISCLDVRRFPQ